MNTQICSKIEFLLLSQHIQNFFLKIRSALQSKQEYAQSRVS